MSFKLSNIPFSGYVWLKLIEDRIFGWYTPDLLMLSDGFIVLLNLLIHMVFSLKLFPETEPLLIDFIDGIIDGWTAIFCYPLAYPNPYEVILGPVVLIPKDVWLIALFISNCCVWLNKLAE